MIYILSRIKVTEVTERRELSELSTKNLSWVLVQHARKTIVHAKARQGLNLALGCLTIIIT